MDFNIVSKDHDGSALDPDLYGSGTRATFLSISIICLMAGASVLTAKVIPHVREGKRLRLEDWLAASSLPFAVGFVGACTMALSAGSLGRVAPYSKAVLAAEIMYIFSLLFGKLSLLSIQWIPDPSFDIGRTIRHTQVWRKYMGIGLAVIVSLYSLISFVVLLVQCSPHSAWLKGASTEHCLDINALMMVNGTLDIITALAAVTIAYPILRLRWNERSARENQKSRLLSSAVFGSLVLPLTLVRTAILSSPNASARAIPILSILIVLFFPMASLLLSPCPPLFNGPPDIRVSSEESGESPHQRWQQNKDEKRGRSAGRDRSYTDLSIHSATKLFSTRDERSRTPDPNLLRHIPIEIMVETEVTRTEERRKNWGKQGL